MVSNFSFLTPVCWFILRAFASIIHHWPQLKLLNHRRNGGRHCLTVRRAGLSQQSKPGRRSGQRRLAAPDARLCSLKATDKWASEGRWEVGGRRTKDEQGEGADNLGKNLTIPWDFKLCPDSDKFAAVISWNSCWFKIFHTHHRKTIP